VALQESILLKLISTGGKKVLGELKNISKELTGILKKQEAVNKTALKLNKVRAATRGIKGSGLNLNTSTPLEGLNAKQVEQKLSKLSGTTRRYTVALNKANKELNEYVRSLATSDGAQNKFTGSNRKVTTQVSALQNRLNGLSRSNKEYTSTLQAVLRGEQALFEQQNKRAVDELAQFPQQRLKKDGTPDQRFTKTGVEDLVGTTIEEFNKGEIANSINGLNNYINRLEALRAKVELGSKSFNDLQQQIALVNLKLKEADPLSFSSKIDPKQKAFTSGPATDLSDNESVFREKLNFAEKLSRVDDKRLQLLSRISDSSLDEVKKQQLKNQLAQTDVNLQQKELELARANNKEVERELSSLNKKQRQQKFRKQGRDSIISSALIGGGFPFLFGGGPVQAAAGALGGGIGAAVTPGGGFAGSIAATAAVSQISQAVQGVTELGQALNLLTMDINKLVDKLGIAGTEEARRIQIIEETQGKQAALAEATKSMSLVIGNEGINALQQFGSTMQNVQGTFSRFGLKLQAGFAQLFNNILESLKNKFPKLFSGSSGGITQQELSKNILKEDFKVDAADGARTKVNKLEAERAALQKQLINSRGTVEPPQAFDFLKGGGALFPSQADVIIEEKNKTQAIQASIQEKNKEIKAAQQLLNLLKGTSDLMAEQNLAEANAKLLTDEKLKGSVENVKLLKATLNGTKEEELIKQRVKEIEKDLLNNKVLQKNIDLERIENQVIIERDLERQVELATQLTDILKEGMASAIENLISGAKSLKDVLGSVLKQFGGILLRAGINNAFPGLGSGFGLASAQGNYISNGIRPFATGGMATKPTIGLVGEAGEDEYIIPASKMSTAMQRYSSGVRGQSVIPGTGSSQSVGGGGGSTTVNYSGPILTFNSEEFVPKAAVGAIIASATSQGAAMGETRTIRAMQNRRSIRTRVGI